MLVSLIIPYKGREELLECTIQSILDLEYDLKEIEIVVVTQNKKLECRNVNLNGIHFTTIFRPETDTISVLRNVGVQNASGEYLVFLDADIRLSRNWLNTMFSELEANPERVLVSAVQQCGLNAGSIEKIRVILNSTSADNHVEFLGGANLFMNRQIFKDVGGFPEDLVTCEDYYFTNNVHQLGEVYCTSKASFIHLGEDKSYSDLFRKEIWRGQANLQSIRGRKILHRELPSILTPIWQALFFLLTLISVFWGKITFGLFGLGMYCLPIILYAIRVYRVGRKSVSFADSLWFYGVYFSARTIGTIIGFFRAIRR